MSIFSRDLLYGIFQRSCFQLFLVVYMHFGTLCIGIFLNHRPSWPFFLVSESSTLWTISFLLGIVIVLLEISSIAQLFFLMPHLTAANLPSFLYLPFIYLFINFTPFACVFFLCTISDFIRERKKAKFQIHVWTALNSLLKGCLSKKLKPLKYSKVYEYNQIGKNLF